MTPNYQLYYNYIRQNYRDAKSKGVSIVYKLLFVISENYQAIVKNLSQRLQVPEKCMAVLKVFKKSPSSKKTFLSS